MLSLKCAVQTYDWGKIGSHSEVAKLAKNVQSDFHLIESQTYAELWLGTHPNGPTTILTEEFSSLTLADWIQVNRHSLGEKVIEKFGFDLPFLFKVLSVNKALSIQAHPNKTHAEQLHSLRPDLYKDPNHKPELAIALTNFEALCGFRLPETIYEYLEVIPELMAVVGEENAKKLNNVKKKEALKSCFKTLMTSPEDVVKVNLKKLADRFSNPENITDEKLLKELFLRLYRHYPDDVGCFVIYFLNFVKLKPGEALYLAPNEPHAYLLGDCAECMACSDNVVRAGLTPKFKDVDTLCEMLTYVSQTPEEQIFVGSYYDDFSTLFSPPVPDFAVIKTKLPEGEKEYTLPTMDISSVILCVNGQGSAESDAGQVEKITKGSAFYISAGLSVKITINSKEMLFFRAHANV